VPLLDVRTIETPDSVRNGTRNGAIVGGAVLGVSTTRRSPFPGPGPDL